MLWSVTPFRADNINEIRSIKAENKDNFDKVKKTFLPMKIMKPRLSTWQKRLILGPILGLQALLFTCRHTKIKKNPS